MNLPNDAYNEFLISAKIKKAAEKFGLIGQKKRSTNRLPPGQYLTDGFPVLDLGVRPHLDFQDFTLTIDGEVENPVILKQASLLALPSVEVTKDFHCVTRWSRYDLTWKGVSFLEIAKLVKPKPSARFVVFSSRDDYTTNLPIEECLKEDVLVAYELEGETIPTLHGGPVRMLVPHLYGWKSAKFLNKITFLKHDEPGFWEVRGYNNHGDPWLEERYS
ncbi:MAG: sulfite oxidase-like oxidoreductase [Patescibacteria group bacterium]